MLPQLTLLYLFYLNVIYGIKLYFDSSYSARKEYYIDVLVPLRVILEDIVDNYKHVPEEYKNFWTKTEDYRQSKRHCLQNNDIPPCTKDKQELSYHWEHSNMTRHSEFHQTDSSA